MEEPESFLDLGDLSGVPEEHTKPEAEYEMRITVFEKREKDKGPYLYLIFELIEDPLAKNVQHVMMLPKPGDDEKTRLRKLRAVKNFYTAFSIPTSGSVNFAEYVGNTGWALLGEKEDEEYGMQNRVRRFK